MAGISIGHNRPYWRFISAAAKQSISEIARQPPYTCPMPWKCRQNSGLSFLNRRPQGAYFTHGQERNQFPKADRALPLLGLWHRRTAAGVPLCPLRLPRSVRTAVKNLGIAFRFWTSRLLQPPKSVAPK